MSQVRGDVEATPRRPRPSVLLIVVGSVVVWLCIGSIVTGVLGLFGGHAGGDPGAVRERALRQISAAIPAGAIVDMHDAGGLQWTSCDGRAGTEGWSDVTVDYQFTSNLSSKAVLAHAAAQLAAQGWTALAPRPAMPGPYLEWTKIIAGKPAHAQLGIFHRVPSESSWDLVATAPPQGQRASGC